MNELLSDAKTVLLWLFGAIMALLAWFGKRQIKRIDDLERDSVTRKEFAAVMDHSRQDRQRMHDENRAELQYIRERVDGIADRQ